MCKCNSRYKIKYLDSGTGSVTIESITVLLDENHIPLNPPLTHMAGSEGFNTAFADVQTCKCKTPIHLECLQRRTFCVPYDNGVTPGSSENGCDERPNFVRFSWEFDVLEWIVNGQNVANAGDTLGPFTQWTPQLEGWSDYFDSVDPNPNSDADFGFLPAPTWRYSKITGCDPAAVYGTLTLKRDDGCIYKIYPIPELATSKIDKIYRHATIDSNGKKEFHYCTLDEEGNLVEAEAPKDHDCWVSCDYKFDPFLDEDAVSSCTTEIRDACDVVGEDEPIKFIQVAHLCNGVYSFENYTLESWNNAETPDDLVVYEPVGEVVDCATGEPFPPVQPDCKCECKTPTLYKQQFHYAGMENTGVPFGESATIEVTNSDQSITVVNVAAATSWGDQMQNIWEAAFAAAYPDMCEVATHWQPIEKQDFADHPSLPTSDFAFSGAFGQFMQFEFCPGTVYPVSAKITASSLESLVGKDLITGQGKSKIIYHAVCLSCEDGCSDVPPKCAIPVGEDFPVLPDPPCTNEIVPVCEITPPVFDEETSEEISGAEVVTSDLLLVITTCGSEITTAAYAVEDDNLVAHPPIPTGNYFGDCDTLEPFEPAIPVCPEGASFDHRMCYNKIGMWVDNSLWENSPATHITNATQADFLLTLADGTTHLEPSTGGSTYIQMRNAMLNAGACLVQTACYNHPSGCSPKVKPNPWGLPDPPMEEVFAMAWWSEWCAGKELVKFEVVTVNTGDQAWVGAYRSLKAYDGPVVEVNVAKTCDGWFYQDCNGNDIAKPDCKLTPCDSGGGFDPDCFEYMEENCGESSGECNLVQTQFDPDTGGNRDVMKLLPDGTWELRAPIPQNIPATAKGALGRWVDPALGPDCEFIVPHLTQSGSTAWHFFHESQFSQSGTDTWIYDPSIAPAFNCDRSEVVAAIAAAANITATEAEQLITTGYLMTSGANIGYGVYTLTGLPTVENIGVNGSFPAPNGADHGLCFNTEAGPDTPVAEKKKWLRVTLPCWDDVKNAITGTYQVIQDQFVKICNIDNLLQSMKTECPNGNVEGGDYTGAIQLTVGRPNTADDVPWILYDNRQQPSTPYISGANYAEFKANAEALGYRIFIAGPTIEAHYMCPCPPGLNTAGQYFLEVDGETAAKPACTPLSEVENAPTKVIADAVCALRTLGCLDEAMLEQLIKFNANLECLFEDCVVGVERAEYTNSDVETDFDVSANNTSIKIGVSADPLEDDAQAVANAIEVCLAAGGSVDILWKTTTGDTGGGTITAQQDPFSSGQFNGTGNFSWSTTGGQAGKLTELTAICTEVVTKKSLRTTNCGDSGDSGGGYAPIDRCFKSVGEGQDVKVGYNVSDCDPADAEIGSTVTGGFSMTTAATNITSVESVTSADPSVTFAPAVINAGGSITVNYSWVWDGSTIPNAPITVVMTTEKGKVTVTGPDLSICSGGGSSVDLVTEGVETIIAVKEFCFLGEPSVYQNSAGEVVDVSGMEPCDPPGSGGGSDCLYRSEIMCDQTGDDEIFIQQISDCDGNIVRYETLDGQPYIPVKPESCFNRQVFRGYRERCLKLSDGTIVNVDAMFSGGGSFTKFIDTSTNMDFVLPKGVTIEQVHAGYCTEVCCGEYCVLNADGVKTGQVADKVRMMCGGKMLGVRFVLDDGSEVESSLIDRGCCAADPQSFSGCVGRVKAFDNEGFDTWDAGDSMPFVVNGVTVAVDYTTTVANPTDGKSNWYQPVINAVVANSNFTMTLVQDVAGNVGGKPTWQIGYNGSGNETLTIVQNGNDTLTVTVDGNGLATTTWNDNSGRAIDSDDAMQSCSGTPVSADAAGNAEIVTQL